MAEITHLENGFNLIFNVDRKYNQAFLEYIDEIIKIRTAEENGLVAPCIKITQHSFTELLRFIGELKKAGEIKNNYPELAEIINQSFSPEIQIKPVTIIDRLKNKKGYN